MISHAKLHDVLEQLRALGGRATTRQIASHLGEPLEEVGPRLVTLCTRGFVHQERSNDGLEWIWSLLRIVVMLAMSVGSWACHHSPVAPVVCTAVADTLVAPVDTLKAGDIEIRVEVCK